jgi:hypothetical protein
LTQNFTPRIHISEEDFASITRYGKLLDGEGHLGFVEFEHVMRSQIKLFVQRQLSNTLTAGACTKVEVSTYFHRCSQNLHILAQLQSNWLITIVDRSEAHAGVTAFYAQDALARK